MNKSTLTSLSYKNKTFSLGASFLAVASIFGSAHVANAATFNFSFSNEDGATNGTVEGTIELPDGDGTFAASAVTVTSAPAGLGFTLPVNALADGSAENVFSVVGGEINIAATNFFGLINLTTALAFNTTIDAGSTFLDVLNAVNFGVTGVKDSNSSTLTFSSASNVTTPEPGTILGLLAVGLMCASTRKRKG